MRLRLETKFLLTISIIFTAGIIATALALYPALVQRTEGEISYRGMILIETMNAVRSYTTLHINPLLSPGLERSETFIPEMVPAFSARTVFDNFRSSDVYQNYLYKEATENPTNPRDLADPFELSLIERFRADSTLTDLSGFTTREGQYMFYSARPLRVSSETCLQCHGSPEDAPLSMRVAYGTENGFGWNVNDIVAAQTIYVPASDVINYAVRGALIVMGVIIVVFSLVVFTIHTLVRRSVVRPARSIGALAALIDMDKLSPDSPELAAVAAYADRKDEIGMTARVFASMARQVYEREQKLKREVSQLQVRIDKTREMEQVREVTDNDYFRQLQNRAHELRQSRADREGG